MNIDEIIKCMREAHRFGSATDEPEGSRYILMSDTLSNEIIECLEELQLSMSRHD